MTEISGRDAVRNLSQLIEQTNQERDRMADILGNIQKVHLKIRADRDEAQAALAKSQADNESLRKQLASVTDRARNLETEVNMMASAIQVANREISDSGTALLDAAVSVNAEFATPGVRRNTADKQQVGNAIKNEISKVSQSISQQAAKVAKAPSAPVQTAPISVAAATPIVQPQPTAPKTRDTLEARLDDLDKLLQQELNSEIGPQA